MLADSKQNQYVDTMKNQPNHLVRLRAHDGGRMHLYRFQTESRILVCILKDEQ